MAETPNPKSNFTSSLGCSLLFLFPFAACGIFMIGLIGWTLIHWATISHWEEGTATILEVKVRYGDDSDSMGVNARYAYEWEGETFQNDRVSLYGGTDNVGSFQKRIYKELKQSHKRKAPVPCFINPQKPSEAILYRDLRWEMIAFYSVFAELFGGIGMGGILFMLLARGEMEDEAQLEKHHPDEPWKWKREWLEGAIVSSGSSSNPAGAIFVAGYWNVVAIPMWILAPLNLLQGNGWAAIGLLFPLIGILLIIFATRAKLRRAKYGLSTFQLLDIPGVVGGKLEGALMIEKPLYPDDGFDIQLKCEQVISRDKSSKRDILYEDSQLVGYEAAADFDGQMVVPVSFIIPYDCKSTDTEGSCTVTWDIKVKASIPGVDYVEEFEVPVFKTDQSRPDFQEAPSVTSLPDRSAPNGPLKKAGIRLNYDEFGQLFIKTSLSRNLGPAMGLGIFSMIWLVFVYFTYKEFGGAWVSIMAIMGGLSLYSSLNMFLQSSDIEVSEHSLQYRTGWSFMRRVKSIPLQDITGFSYKQKMRSSHNKYSHIYVETQTGRPKVILPYILGDSGCRRMIEVLNAAIWG